MRVKHVKKLFGAWKLIWECRDRAKGRTSLRIVWEKEKVLANGVQRADETAGEKAHWGAS
jgi:hypothetical protein